VPDSHLDPGALTDAALLARAGAGDRRAFDLFVERHQASVFRFARTQVSRPDDGEDLLQQTFLSAWQAAGTFRGDGPARGWLFTITRHAATRLRQRHAREALDDTPVEDLGVQAGWGQSNPEGLAIRHERHTAIASALAALPAEDREILTLRDLEGTSGEEAAALLGVGLAAMKSRLHRARLRLAAELRKGGHDVAR
jgi:RNA polymerase sigma-70 factor (ECF subfamily)